MVRILLAPMLKKYRRLILSMIFVSSLGIALMFGLSGAYLSLEASLNTYVSDYRYADAVITTEELSDTTVCEKLSRLSGIKCIDARIVGDVTARLESGRILTLRGFSYGQKDFQRVYIREFKESTEYPNAMLEAKFAEANNIKAGDLMEVYIDDAYETVCVAAIVSSPECLSVQQDSYSWGENSDFGYAFIPEELTIGTDFENEANQFLISLEDWADAATVLKDAEACLTDAGNVVALSYLYADSPVYKKIDINLQPIETMSLFLPMVFFVCMIAVVSLFLSQIIRQCRKDIGVLRALGFKQREVRTLFSVITLFISFFACLLGCVLGVGMMILVNRMYGSYFALPQLVYKADLKRVGIAVLITFAANQLAAFLSTRAISRILPSEAMSREVPSASKTPAWLQTLLSGLGPAGKYGCTSILRNTKRFVFSVICVAASLMLILCAVAFNTSKNDILQTLYEKRIHYDAQIFMNVEPSNDLLTEIESLSGTDKCKKMGYLQRTVSANGNTADILINGISGSLDKITILDERENVIAISHDGIVLEAHTAEELGVQVGDTITFEDGQTLSISAISYQSLNRIQYVSYETMKLLGPADKYVVLCNTVDQQELLDFMSEQDSYAYTNFTDIMRAGNEETFRTYSLAVYILIAFAIIMGFIIVNNTMQTNLFEQKKELSVLRAIGFQISSISSIWMIQSALQFVLSCLIGLPVGTWVATYALGQMATEGREYPFAHDIWQYLVTIIIVFAYIIFSHFSAMRSIRKWNIAETTKDKE